MSYSVGHISPESKLCQEVSLEALHQIIAPTVVLEVLEQQQAFEERERHLNMVNVIYILIAMSLYATASMAHVMEFVWHVVCLLWSDERERTGGQSFD